jgi:hypothetical protein
VCLGVHGDLLQLDLVLHMFLLAALLADSNLVLLSCFR